MKNFLFLIVFLSFANSFSQTPTVSSQKLSIGEERVIHSSVLNEDRKLNIYLPNGFDANKSYPVIYLLDGSMDEDFLHVAGLVQFFNLMFTMPETIVVGIANVDRKRDFTFHTDLEDLKKNYPTTGHSDKFISFLESELQPYLEANFKTSGEKYLIGQSLGGLVASEILLTKSQLFSHYFIISPSLWWDNESLLSKSKELMAKNDYKGKYVYVSVGAKEEKIMQKEAESFYKTVSTSAKNAKSDFVLMNYEDHATILHQSLYEAFSKLFKKRY